MLKIIIHCPINCEEFCFREIKEKVPESLKNQYKVEVLEHGTLNFEIFSQDKEKFLQWKEILSKCATIEMLRLELESREISPIIQIPKKKKIEQVKFLEKCFETALTRLLQITSFFTIEVVINTKYWKNFSQQEFQGIFKRVAMNHKPPVKLLLKNADSELHINITKQKLKITIDLPTQKFFSLSKVHPTPSFPSVAYVMLQLALQQSPYASSFVDGMCGAGTLAFMTVKVLKNKQLPLITIGGFDFDLKWVEAARENARILNIKDINFYQWDLLNNDFETFPFHDCDVILAHPPYGHFVHYTTEILQKLYENLLHLFIRSTNKKGCLIINTPRDDILIPLIDDFPINLVKTINIPRKISIVKLWVLIKKSI